MKLISDEVSNKIGITESLDEATGQKAMYIEGIFAQAELPNRNGRIYPKAVLEHAIAEYIEKYVNTHRALGETDHPDRSNVDPKDACIMIESLRWEGNDVIGKAKVLSTPQGQILRALLSDGVQLGVSTRGLGSTHTVMKDGVEVSMVESDYQIRAIDVVHNPSGINCFVNGILESKEYTVDEHGSIKVKSLSKTKAPRAKRTIKESSKSPVTISAKEFSDFVTECINNLK